jgi:hypothetical protein
MTVPGQGAEAPSTREDSGGTDRVKSAEVPTNVKEVVARFVLLKHGARDWLNILPVRDAQSCQ